MSHLRTIDFLFAQEALSAEGRRKAYELFSPPQNWPLWSARFFLFLGVSLTLAGIVSFFAFNWQSLSVLLKFTLTQGLFVLALIAAFLLKLETLYGKLALTFASVMVGVFFAVFGQIYQTGADSYMLFMAWAAFILPFVLIGRFSPLWAVFIVVSGLFIFLYGEQNGFTHHLYGVLGFFYICLALREFLPLQELKPKWTRYFLVALILAVGLTMAMNNATKFTSTRGEYMDSTWLIFLPLVVFYSLKSFFDSSALSLALLGLMAAFIGAIAKYFFSLPGLFLLAFLVLGLVYLTIHYLKYITQKNR